ncbi:MAG: spore cortex biosynthesis protein YabQ [Oscillospiraceae bacterium]|nr:spore cortex biosynthesis protein YabQ [Oscillospiraceae bacterium]
MIGLFAAAAAETELETFFTLREQAELFLLSVALGVALGVLFDFFRALRIVFPPLGAMIPTAICDILYFVICGLALYALALTKARGSVENFTIPGAVFGAVLYIAVAGNAIIGVMRKLFSRIYFAVSKCFSRILGKAAELFAKAFPKRKTVENSEHYPEKSAAAGNNHSSFWRKIKAIFGESDKKSEFHKKS